MNTVPIESKNLTKPRRLKKGDTIAVVAPSSPCWEEYRMEEGLRFLENQGFNIKRGASISRYHGYLAGEDQFRAADLTAAFLDEEVDAIFCLRGGYGTMRMVEYLDLEGIYRNPKIFLGFSDITVLHTVFNRPGGFVTFHGPMVSTNMDKSFHILSEKSLFNLLTGSLDFRDEQLPPLKGLVPGKAEGVLCGGNLSLIASTLGTPYEIDTKGKILFLEDIDVEPYAIDRALTQLRLSGKLDECEGIVLGDWNNCVTRGSYAISQTLEDVFAQVLGPLRIPLLSGLASGHCNPMITLPLGVLCRMDAGKAQIELLESGVC